MGHRVGSVREAGDLRRLGRPAERRSIEVNT